MSTPPADTPGRHPYGAAAIASAAVLVLYILTLGPTTAMWDTSEYIAASYTLGIPHPPGNPFFVLLGRVFTILPIAPGIGMRVNMLTAVSSAVAAGVWFLLAYRVLSGWFARPWERYAGAALATLLAATAFTVWAHSVVNDKVYAVALAGLAIVSWLALRWSDDPEAPRAGAYLVLAAYLTGLGYANHMAGFLALPAIGLLVLMRHPQTLLRWRLLLGCAGALALGVTPFATQPIRAAHFPAINQGEVTGCADEIGFRCTFSSTTLERFRYNAGRGQYAKPSLLERQAPVSAQVGMWWLYFKWQWLRDLPQQRGGLQFALAVVFLALGLAGAWKHYRHDRTSFVYFGTFVFTVTLLLVWYMNFRYGASQAPELAGSVPREPRDRDYFYMWGYSAWGVWSAFGLLWVWRGVAGALDSLRGNGAAVGHGEAASLRRGKSEGVAGAAPRAAPHRLSLVLAAPVLALAFVPLVANWDSATRRHDTDTAAFARDLLNSVEPYGILITAGDNDLFPVWYAQQVEGVRRDVILANTELMNTDWFVRQMIRARQFDYDPDTGPALYRDREWPRPDGPVFALTYDEADSVPLFTQIVQPERFEAGGIRTILSPRVLVRSEWLIYRMILDNPDRPVHFAWSTGSLPFELGLDDYVTTHGLTRRLVREPVEESDTMVLHPVDGWMDLAATAELWDSFEAPEALIRKRRWVDQPSLQMPRLYLLLGIALRDSMVMRGHTERAAAVLERVRHTGRALGYELEQRPATAER